MAYKRLSATELSISGREFLHLDFEKDSSNSGHGWFTVVTDVEVSICHGLGKYVVLAI